MGGCGGGKTTSTLFGSSLSAITEVVGKRRHNKCHCCVASISICIETRRSQDLFLPCRIRTKTRRQHVKQSNYTDGK